jgi:succinyl-diaminopimelate desuccinylase
VVTERDMRAYEDPIVELTRRLVAIPSENPPGRHYAECAEVLADAMRDVGLAPRVSETHCVQASTAGSGRCLYLHGHYDVVPAQDAAQFDPALRDGRIHGRGSADMKGGLAAMLYAVAAARDAGLELDGRVGLNFVPDEETGGATGSEPLAEQGRLAPDAIGMVTAEPTSGVVWNANRGAISLALTVHGREAHVGLSHAGVNAFERVLDVAAALRELGAQVARRRTAYTIDPPEAAASILLVGGRAESGSGFNVVPGRATFTVDRRPNPEESLATEKQRLLDTLASFDFPIDVDVLQEGDAAGSSEDDPLARALAASIAEVEGAPPRLELCPGLLETRWYAREGIPAYAYGPGRLDLAHGPGEHVEVDALLRAALVYARTIERTL